MNDIPTLPYVPEKDANVLWSNLSHVGVYKKSPLVGTYDNLNTPKSNIVTLKGSLLSLFNNNINKNLDLLDLFRAQPMDLYTQIYQEGY
jgi:hypothetical protein